MENLLLQKNAQYSMLRYGRFVVAQLHKPHLCLSTSHVNGGQRTDLTHLANHQSCEGTGHFGREGKLHAVSQREYHTLACGEASLPQETTALMGTAASMDYAALAQIEEGSLNVTACVTAGVRGNAARAGDEANWHEEQGKWVKLGEAQRGGVAQILNAPILSQGTINVLLLINQPLTSAALARCVAVIAEAKAGVLQELAVPSLQGFGNATGTGTDQFTLAAPLAEAHQAELTWSGHHTRLGEWVAKATQQALREALRWQNGLEPSLTRNIGWAGKAIGILEGPLKERLLQVLSPATAEVAKQNFEGLMHHPRIAAALYCLRTLEERFRYGTLPVTLLHDLRLEQAVLLVMGLAAQSKSEPAFAKIKNELTPFASDLPELVIQAIAMGFEAKWA